MLTCKLPMPAQLSPPQESSRAFWQPFSAVKASRVGCKGGHVLAQGGGGVQQQPVQLQGDCHTRQAGVVDRTRPQIVQLGRA